VAPTIEVEKFRPVELELMMSANEPSKTVDRDVLGVTPGNVDEFGVAGDMDSCERLPLRPVPVAPYRGSRVGWVTVAVAGLAGMGFTTVQIMDKITVLSNPNVGLVCDVNATLSCSGVMEAWQSSVLGPPNPLIGAIMFAILASAGLAGALGSQLSRAYVGLVAGLAVFFAMFATWFMYQTAFEIGKLCLWCTGITTAILIISGVLMRIAVRAGVFGTGGLGQFLTRTVDAYGDVIFWFAWWAGVGLMLAIGLVL
jgi:uncharacterized membrane protein